MLKDSQSHWEWGSRKYSNLLNYKKLDFLLINGISSVPFEQKSWRWMESSQRIYSKKKKYHYAIIVPFYCVNNCLILALSCIIFFPQVETKFTNIRIKLNFVPLGCCGDNKGKINISLFLRIHITTLENRRGAEARSVCLYDRRFMGSIPTRGRCILHSFIKK